MFVSYSHSSDLVQSVQTIVQLFSSQLSLMLAWEPRIFFDQREIELGAEWPIALQEALSSSKVLLTFLTPRYFQSSWNVAEWVTFSEREKRSEVGAPLIFPIVVGGANAMPEDVRRRHVLDISDVFTPLLTESSRATDEISQRIRALAVSVVRSLTLVSDSPPSIVVEPREVEKLLRREGPLMLSL